MLWWFLILGVSAAVVVSVALTLYMRVRRQMKRSAAHKAELEGLDHSSPEA
jgi:preprotein translocase subunit YajC